ncbi:helix-hairpin-helix domain-containing protein [Dechloromonas sp. H13]|uniref:ComEA family DNA-binding protein n=1 Tax=Dechloromonas sp. H13 TaxID=2570193 RepID=UPI001884B8C5|nr:helix-hairpin-helix domain-containing protein [Dechloromonas sp. H13]
MTPISSPDTATRLGETHGYRFDGDFVHLNAEIDFSDAELTAAQSWALQLWASDRGFAGAEPAGVKVAELPIQPLPGRFWASGYCSAMPPAGPASQSLALALVARAADGRPQVRDLAVYPAGESFLQPRLVGEVDCKVADGAVELAIETIANPRAADNLSGTLVLEVWALDAPYAGGSWSGSPVASLVLGVLGGSGEWSANRFTLSGAMPAAGAALTVMLREWTPAGYVTRDYRNFAAAPATVEKAVVAKPATAAKPAVTGTAAAAATLVKAKPAAAARPAVAAKPAEIAKAPAARTEKPAAQPAGKVGAAKPASGKAVSVNTASEAELSAVKGLPPAVARAIVAARPYATLDEVCKAKGMGPKLLARLRDQLAL